MEGGAGNHFQQGNRWQTRFRIHTYQGQIRVRGVELSLPGVNQGQVNLACPSKGQIRMEGGRGWFILSRGKYTGTENKKGNSAFPNWDENIYISNVQGRGIYSGQPEKLFPRLSKFFPVFGIFITGFFKVFQFFQSSFKFFPIFQFGQNSPPPPWGRMARIYIPDFIS